jgi:hypothetical protein
MSLSTCNSVSNLINALSNNPSSNVQLQTSTLKDVVQEARSSVISENINNTNILNETYINSNNEEVTITISIIQGLKNRLFLKYIGVDYEMFNTKDLLYRGIQ